MYFETYLLGRLVFVNMVLIPSLAVNSSVVSSILVFVGCMLALFWSKFVPSPLMIYAVV